MPEDEELTSNRAQREREHEARKANRERIYTKYDKDDIDDGTMIRFYKMYQADGTLYTFGAVKSDHKWYITSVEGPKTWVDFWLFFEEGNLLDARFVFRATDYESLYEFDDEEDDE